LLRTAFNIPLTDTELLEKYQQTLDAKYFAELLKRYNRMLFAVCFKYLKNEDDSKDAVMQIFEKLLENLKDQKVTYFKSWIYMVAKNHCLMQLRKLQTQLKHHDGIVEFQQSLMESNHNPHHIDESETELKLSKLDECIKTLEEKQRECVQLFFIEEKCYQEVTTLTGYDYNKVKSYIQNGKRNLKICMEKKFSSKFKV
jgi:RNA polymerase sigma-70 factor (ECF subfamily)